ILPLLFYNRDMETSHKKTEWIYVAVMMVIASGLCFFELTRNSLGLDEVSSIVISQNWQSMLHILWTKEGNMWLYYLLLHFWEYLGTGEFVIRSLSAIIAVLTVPAFYLFAQRLSGVRSAKIATPLFILSLYFVFYGQFARSYALSLLLITLSSYFFLRIIEKQSEKKYLFWYALTTSLVFYSHILGLLVLMTQYSYFLFFPRHIPWKKFAITWGAIIVSILPLFFSQGFRGGHQLDWLAKPLPIDLPFGIVMLAGDSVFTAVLAGVLILFFVWKKRETLFKKTQESFSIVWLLMWAGFPIIFSFLFSTFVKPIYQPQYFNACLPAFILLVVIALEELKKKKVIYFSLLILVFFFSGLRIFFWYSGANHYLSQYLVIENTRVDDWRGAADYIVTNGKNTDAVIFFSYYIRRPFLYYYNTYPTKNLPTPVEIASDSYDLG